MTDKTLEITKTEKPIDHTITSLQLIVSGSGNSLIIHKCPVGRLQVDDEGSGNHVRMWLQFAKQNKLLNGAFGSTKLIFFLNISIWTI